MAKRRTKKANAKADPAVRLRRTLAKRTKDELIDALMEIAEEDRRVARRLEARFPAEIPLKEIVGLTAAAISDATDFDEREINRNFDYDRAAYREVKRNLSRLVEGGELRSAMNLSLQLMKEGSYQVEMSDEGMMTGDIEECLVVVINALKECDLPMAEVQPWCDAMLQADRVKYICEKELQKLGERFKSSGRKTSLSTSALPPKNRKRQREEFVSERQKKKAATKAQK